MLTSLLVAIYLVVVALSLGVLLHGLVKAPRPNGAGAAIAAIVMAWLFPLLMIVFVIRLLAYVASRMGVA